jgi:hypothetical protein
VLGGQQLSVKLAGRDVADDLLAHENAVVPRPNAARRAALDQDVLDVGIDVESTTPALDDSAEGVDSTGIASLDDRQANRLQREGDDFSHQCRHGAFRAKACMQYPRREQRLDQVGFDPGLQPAAATHQCRGKEGDGVMHALFPQAAGHGLCNTGTPQFVAKQREHQAGVLLDLLHGGLKCITVAACQRIECADIALTGRAQNQRTVIG